MNKTSVELSGKVVAVTGAFGALGAAVTQTLSACGASVAQLDFAPVPADRVGQRWIVGGVDLSDAKAARVALDSVVAQAGALHGLVNIAGGFQFEKLEEGSLDTWDAMYRINLRTALACCQAALPHLTKTGGARIVNVGAMGAVKAGAGMGAYAASKAGIAKLTESLAEELKDRGVTVNAVLPSMIDTPRNRHDMPQADFSRWVPASSLANVIAFLLSDAASAVTGALIPVAGRL